MATVQRPAADERRDRREPGASCESDRASMRHVAAAEPSAARVAPRDARNVRRGSAVGDEARSAEHCVRDAEMQTCAHGTRAGAPAATTDWKKEMSEEDQISLVGRMTMEHSSAKKDYAMLLAKISMIGTYLKELGESLCDLDPKQYVNRHRSPPGTDRFPTREELEALVSEFRTVKTRKDDLYRQLKEMGHEPARD